jgi:hypothetical protein
MKINKTILAVVIFAGFCLILAARIFNLPKTGNKQTKTTKLIEVGKACSAPLQALYRIRSSYSGNSKPAAKSNHHPSSRTTLFSSAQRMQMSTQST